MNKNAEFKDIGEFIKNLRSERGITQLELAQALKTSQSAVARIETGEHNVTTSQLYEISKILGRKIINPTNTIDFEIEGGKELKGKIKTNPSKNGALGLLCASLLNDGVTVLHNIPQIEEVKRLLEVFVSIGIDIKWISKNSLEIRTPKKFKMDRLASDSASKIRSALMMIGALTHKMKKFKLPHAGGCKMGLRTISAHRYALEELGVSIKTYDKFYEIENKNLKETEIIMYESSDTATENALICASLIPGKTTIRYAPPNYQVQDVCFFLEKCGVKIQGIGSTTLVVEGVKKINQKIEHYNSEDPIESMMFIASAIVTKSELTVERCPIHFLELELYKLKKMGLNFTKSKNYFAQNGRTVLCNITIKKSRLSAPPDKIHAQPYPGINVDNLPFFVPIACVAKGKTAINDWMWENRAIYYTELNKLGGNVTLLDPHRVIVDGPAPFKATQIVCPPALRPAVIIMIAMLAAEGKSILRNVYSINRGYEEIAERLNSIGAKIKVIS